MNPQNKNPNQSPNQSQDPTRKTDRDFEKTDRDFEKKNVQPGGGRDSKIGQQPGQKSGQTNKDTFEDRDGGKGDRY